jgi:hypothetical protein
MPVRCAFWSNSGQAAEGCSAAASPGVVAWADAVVAVGALDAAVAPAGALPAATAPPLQAATTHTAAASEVPRMITSQRWRTPAAAGVGPGDPCSCNP